jgi:hypothetical protein
MKQKFFFLLLCCLLLLGGCQARTPEKLVARELNAIKNLDEKTIQNFVSYEDIVKNRSRNTDIGSNTTEAVQLFFKDFDYEILSSSIGKDTALVTAQIQTLDARSLAHDLCLELARKSILPDSSMAEQSMNAYFTILGDILKKNTYELVSCEVHFELARMEHGWSIQSTPTLEDELVGGLITCLSDPYLITPEELATATLDVFDGFSAEDWITYLKMDDVFSTGSKNAADTDRILAEKIAENFSYQISQVKVEKDTATATADIQSLDMHSVFSLFKEKLLSYAKTTESVLASEEELADKSASLLSLALQESQDCILRSVPLTFTNNGSGWEMTFGDNFGQVLLGGTEEALSTFAS